MVQVVNTGEERPGTTFGVMQARINKKHPASRYGLGVLEYSLDNTMLDGATFRRLRDGFGWEIRTDEKEAVCGALGVPLDEPGIIAL